MLTSIVFSGRGPRFSTSSAAVQNASDTVIRPEIGVVQVSLPRLSSAWYVALE